MNTRKYALAAALALIGLLTPISVWADSVVFDASGLFSDGSMLTGTVTADTTTGLVTAANLTTTGTTSLGPFTFLLIQHPVKGNPSLDTVGIFDASTVDGVSLVFPMLSSFGFGSVVPLCGNSPLNCPQVGGFIISDFFTASGPTPLTHGMLTPTASPEPSSLLLLGICLLGLLGLGLRFRRRIQLA